MNGNKVELIDLEKNSKYQRLLAGIPQTSGMKAGQVVLQPGESVGSHSTDSNEEIIIILEGSIEAVIEGKAGLCAAKGQVVYIPPGTLHDMKNAGDSPARYIYVVNPV
jgi:quercetin dioxygenase-like cupin family protein